MKDLSLDHIGLLVLVAGVCGAGKSVAIDVLSDLGFSTVENLPVPLFRNFIELSNSSPTKFTRTALSLDIDSQEKQEALLKLLHDSSALSKVVRLIFLDCKTDVIVKRYGQTRRPHPGFNPSKDKTLQDAITREKNRLFPIREGADLLIDTSELNVHDLRREITGFIDSLQSEPMRAMRVNFLSFGFKHGVPIDCDLVIDARFLPNPYFNDALRDKTGCDREIVDYVMQADGALQFIDKYSSLLSFLLPHYAASGKSYLNIGVGCTGGRHRSVVVSESLAARISKVESRDKYLLSVRHRDIDKPQ